jgi:tetratricopeptide (TPR) repeat protein
MSLISMPSGHISLRFSILSSLPLLLLLAQPSNVAGQSVSSPAAKNLAIESHFSAAQKAQQDKDYATADREYRAVLALAPDFAEVHMNLGLVYQLQDRSTEAMAEFRRALQVKPGLTGANFFLGVDYCKLGDGAKAIPYLTAALRAEPDRPDTWLWLATAQEISGQLRAEVATLQRALELRPKDVDVFYLLGSAYERLGKQAVAHLQKVAPGSSRSEQLLAESYAASSEWPSAVIHFQNALTASPNRAGLHAELGEVLLRAGKVNHAIREFDEELRRNPGNLRSSRLGYFVGHRCRTNREDSGSSRNRIRRFCSRATPRCHPRGNPETRGTLAISEFHCGAFGSCVSRRAEREFFSGKGGGYPCRPSLYQTYCQRDLH